MNEEHAEDNGLDSAERGPCCPLYRIASTLLVMLRRSVCIGRANRVTPEGRGRGGEARRELVD